MRRKDSPLVGHSESLEALGQGSRDTDRCQGKDIGRLGGCSSTIKVIGTDQAKRDRSRDLGTIRSQVQRSDFGDEGYKDWMDFLVNDSSSS